jgi:hypothetical protein
MIESHRRINGGLEGNARRQQISIARAARAAPTCLQKMGFFFRRKPPRQSTRYHDAERAMRRQGADF